MSVTQYIGSRYVPLLADPVEWSAEKEYEPLTIVTHEGNSYTSRQFVPKGIDIENSTYWAMTGNYNAQVEQYRRETAQAVENVTEWLDDAQVQYAAKSFAFDTVEEMQRAANLYAGAICHTNGFHAKGDGGAAWYVVGTDGTPNDKDIINCLNGLVALFVAGGIVKPEQLGAYGNGQNDDTEVIQYVLDNFDNIEFCQKAYSIKELTISGRKCIDFNNATLNYSGSGNAITLNINNTKLKNLRMHSNYVGTAIYGAAWFSTFENVFIEYFSTGLDIDASSLSGTAVNNVFTNIFLRDMTYRGIRYGGPSNAKLTDAQWMNLFISCTHAEQYTPDAAFYIGSAGGHKICNVHIYGPWQTALSIVDANRTDVTNVEIENYIANGVYFSRTLGDINISNFNVCKTSDGDGTAFGFEKSSAANTAYLYGSNIRFKNASGAMRAYFGGGTFAEFVNCNLSEIANITGYGLAYIDGENTSGVNPNGYMQARYKKERLSSSGTSFQFNLAAYALRLFKVTIYGGTGSSWWNPAGDATTIELFAYNDNGTLRTRQTNVFAGSFEVTVTPTLADGVLTIRIDGAYNYAYAAIEEF